MRKGSALATVLLVMIVIFIFAITMIIISEGQYIFTGQERNTITSYFMAQSGIEYIRVCADNWGIEAGKLPYKEELEFTTGTCSLVVDSFDAATGKYKAFLTGKHGIYKTKLEVIFSFITENGSKRVSIDNWNQLEGR